MGTYKGIFTLLASICAIIFLSIFSSCNSNSNYEQEVMEYIKRNNKHNFEFDHQDSITYIGNNWYKVTFMYDFEPDVYSPDGYLYYKINKVGNRFTIEEEAQAYSRCGSFIENLPATNRIKLWFKTIKYDYVHPYFLGNLCLVMKDNKCGFINSEGDEIIPSKYDEIKFVLGDIYEIDRGRQGRVRSDSLIDCWLRVKLDNKFGIITYDEKEVIPCKYDELEFSTSPDDIGFFESSITMKAKLDNKLGVITYKKGEFIEIIPCKYDDLVPVSYNVVKAKLNNKYGIINYDGEEIIPFKYDDLTTSMSGQGNIQDYLVITKSNNSYGLINFQIKYNWDISKYVVIKLKELLPCTFDLIETKEESKGMIKVQRNNLWSYYKKDGTQVTDFYEDIKYFDLKNPTFAAKSNGKWGYLDKNGEEITSFRLDEAEEPDNNGIARVTYEGRYGYIDIKTGTIYIKNGYDNDFNSDSNNSMSRTPCRACNGTGQMLNRGGGIVLGTQNCPGCGGSGYHLSW